MAQRNVRKMILFLVLTAMGLLGAGGGIARGESTIESRALVLKNLVDSVGGEILDPGPGRARFWGEGVLKVVGLKAK